MLIEFKKRPGHVRVLKYLLDNGENYFYRISKEIGMSLGQTYTYLKELEELGFLKSRKEQQSNSKRVIRIFSINKEKIKEINGFIK